MWRNTKVPIHDSYEKNQNSEDSDQFKHHKKLLKWSKMNSQKLHCLRNMKSYRYSNENGRT